MSFDFLISLIVTVGCIAIAIFAFLWNRRSFVHGIFAIGMVALGAEAVLNGLCFRASLPSEIVRLQRLRFLTAAFIPGIWLLFSLSFARANYKNYIAKWKWLNIVAFISPLALINLFGGSFFSGLPAIDGSSGWGIPLGWSGYVFHILFLLGSVMIIMNLEGTLRASSGATQWHIKFMVLGVAAFFAVRIFTASQALLFYSVNISMEVFNAVALLIANILILFSLGRSHLLNVDIYLSEGFLYRSVTVFITGIYLLVVGVLARLFRYFSGQQPFWLEALFVFLAFLGLTIVLLSNQLRQQIRRFIHLHLKRPKYDYRQVWTSFTQRLSNLPEIKHVCASISKVVSEIFGTPSVTIWLLDEAMERLTFGGSNVFAAQTAKGLKIAGDPGCNLIRFMSEHLDPIDFDENIGSIKEFKDSNPDVIREANIRYCVPLFAGQGLLGIMTLDEKLTGDSFSFDDFELLKTISNQAAGTILNIKMYERLRQAKEMEAIQTISSFFVHDLKNLASKLSMTMQNLPVHFENPEFRSDALRAISESVNKINTMCSSLSLLRQSIVLQPVEVDLNELINTTLESLNDCKASVIQEFNPLRSISLDPEQIQKVVTNLVLNANDAIERGGEMHVATRQEERWAILSVRDNGCGMSKEFMENSLFRPFKTTKKQGMGIGLYHSKMIVEAHGGRIEVDSEQNKGTTFRVMLPLKGGSV